MTQLRTGALAGLLSAVLIFLASALLQQKMAGLSISLFSLAFLPVLIAGLWHGENAAAIAGLAGAVLMALASGGLGGLIYGGLISLPCYIITYLIWLHRTVPNQTVPNQTAPNQTAPDQTGPAPSAPSSANNEKSTQLEWYPIGHIIAWIALLAGGIALGVVLSLGQTEESFLEAVRPALNQFVPENSQKAPDHPLHNISREDTLRMLGRGGVPSALAIGWFVTILFNLWVAGRLLHGSGQLVRPWPQLARFRLPQYFSVWVLLAIAGCFLAGLPGIFAAGFTGGFLFAYLLMGLAVLHVITEGMKARSFILAAIYFSILFLQIGIFVVLLGIGEHFFRLRDRATTT